MSAFGSSGGALLAVLLLWEAFRPQRLSDPCVISSPTRVAQAGFGLLADSDFWNDRESSGLEFLLWLWRWRSRSRSRSGSAIGLSRRLQYMLSPFVDTLERGAARHAAAAHCHLARHRHLVKVVVVFLGAVIPILINTQSGREVPARRASCASPAASRPQAQDLLQHRPARHGAVRLHRPEIWRRARAARRRGRRALRLHAGIGHMIAAAGNTFQTDLVFFGVLIFMATGLVVGRRLLDRR
jgi:ABC-type nitrate/sulfonate/bicarbonate transport system permease component